MIEKEGKPVNKHSNTIGLIGLGLIGGSIAKTIRRIHPDCHIIAYNRTWQSVQAALSEQVIDELVEQADETFASCDYLFLCAPVSTNVSFLNTIRKFIKPGTILTDVGSTKGDIESAIEQAGLAQYFIGGHPMAGSERVGYEHSTAPLLENAYYILTPTRTVPVHCVEQFAEFVSSLGALPLILDSRQHDFATAAVSHLPHLIAVSLVNLVKDSDNEEHLLKTIAAGGFKDLTRIASSSPAMWEQICVTNHEQIANVLTQYMQSLDKIKQALDHRDGKAIYELFDTAGEYRNSFSITSAGSIKREYELYCDIVDESGAIATIATILAANNISIKNIGIVHNREFQDGVLHIAFYNKEALKRAVQMLQKHRYTVYQR